MMDLEHFQRAQRLREQRRGKVVPLIVSVLVHVGLVAIAMLIVFIAPKIYNPPVRITPLPSEGREQERLKDTQVENVLNQKPEASTAASLADFIATTAQADIMIPKVENVPEDVPPGFGEVDNVSNLRPGASYGTGGSGGSGSLGGGMRMNGAFQGTIHYFDHIERIRDGMHWWVGTGHQHGDKPIYTYYFDIPGRQFTEGFPDSKQIEWFAIDYQATVNWPKELEGEYEFEIRVDDGAIFQIDGKDVIDFDGPHGWDGTPPRYGNHYLKAGKHQFRLVYYQGPRYYIGLTLKYRKRGEHEWRIFDLREVLRAKKKKVDDPLA